MKSTQHKENEVLRKGVIAGVVGFVSWLSIFFLWVPLVSFYDYGEFKSLNPLQVLKIFNIYPQSVLVGLIFFLFFYFTLKYKQKTPVLKILMWLGIIGYLLFYLGYLLYQYKTKSKHYGFFLTPPSLLMAEEIEAICESIKNDTAQDQANKEAFLEL